MSMEEWTGFELSEDVLEEAAQWISALDDFEPANFNGLNEVQVSLATQVGVKQNTVESFNQWLNADPQHQQAYAEMSLLWAKSACIHEISDRLCASNVFALLPLNQMSDAERNAKLSIEEFKQKKLPILLPYPQSIDSVNTSSAQASPAWAYALSICLIIVGLFSPAIQQIL